ncbi:gonadal somatic cell derived factor isoform X3 [Danio rerio]|uniref:Gonadal somatic cell derived factor isoform X2 n=1 Tax=Danio rerio TaxID=7955 RepID=A0A0R4IHC8_DANRE|nr:gonadal somatic cell derived factor isoform X4 [Danio rerio]|eukprot:XP_005173900.1 gonadal somatic cell derived factor isoform X4 [Danio rerio]
MLLRLVLLLLAFPLGEMFVLHPSPEDQSHREQEIKKIILKSLHLPKEPSNSLSQLEHLRESLKNSIHSPPGNSSLPEDSGNSSCCRRSSQVLMKDLGWDGWVVLPESVAFVQCVSCGSGTSVQCCKPTAHHIVPFVYMDASGLVLSTVRLPRDCGCDLAEDTLDPAAMSPP